MEHDAAGQPGYVSRTCFCGGDGCDDPQCACRCHDEIDESSVNDEDAEGGAGT